ncbi:M48 family metalloprotease [Spirulina sp. 06S082]|uniref:M48 family metalloprotease n=1 Tax=Spirulina sp. 06S082 TaxID=3110248 RepID=UPI002B20101F|nr:M48 family metalloprotease [Spirulina sp. 06S082]MEA5469204.1 M48 family metalloprotease [Spirulina sp. 06S082]
MISEPSFPAGQEALSQGDYETAIAHFQRLCEVELDPQILTSARQSLVLALWKSDRQQDAIALCRNLAQDLEENPWAAKTYKDLVLRYQKQAQGTEEQKTGKRQLPTAYQSPSEAAAAAVFVSGREWRNAERAKTWKRLKAPQEWKFWLRQAIATLILFWVVRTSLDWGLDFVNNVLAKLPLVSPIQGFYQNPTRNILIFLVILLAVSPWLLDWVFKYFYKLEPFKFSQLASQYPETAKVLQKLATQYKISRPQLGILPTSAPFSLTYGNLPRNARIIVSDSLLEQLEDDELAAIFASHFSQIVKGDFIFFSGAIALLQIPFTLYWQIAKGGERLSEIIPNTYPQFVALLVQWLGGLSAALFYSIYILWRLPLLYFSRQRLYYSDRFAAEFTGNPNALSRALLKIAVGMAKQIEQRQETIWILEGFDLLMPVGYRQALSLGSLPDKTPFVDVLAWECTNEYRYWLGLFEPHPLIGDRIYLLNRYANFWKLSPEIDLPTLIQEKEGKRRFKLEEFFCLFLTLYLGYLTKWIDWSRGLQQTIYSVIFILVVLFLTAQLKQYKDFLVLLLVWLSYENGVNLVSIFIIFLAILLLDNQLNLEKLKNSYKALPLLQTSMLFGLLFGLAARITLWTIGLASDYLSAWVRLPLWRLIWLHNTVNPFLDACILAAFSFCIIVWINHYFPNIRISPTRKDPRIEDLLSNPKSLPPNNQGVRLTGRLMGRKGISNWLAQDLMLKTSTGSIRLNFVSKAGTIGNLFPIPPRPEKFCDRKVTVSGWFRRGSIPWIDVDEIRTTGTKSTRSGYPVWVTVLAVLSALWSAWLIWNA